MLLRGLAGRVQAARPQRRVLVDQPPGSTLRRRPGSGARTPPASRSSRRRGSGSTGPCIGQCIAALPVHHHRRRQHQTRQPAANISASSTVGRRSRCGCRRPARRRRPRPRRPPRPDGTPRRRRRAAVPARRRRGRRRGGTPAAVRCIGPCAAGSIASTPTTSWPAAASAAATRVPMNPAAPVSSTLTAARTAARRPRAAGSGCRCARLSTSPIASCTTCLNGTRLRSNSANTSTARTPVAGVDARVQIGHQSDCGVTHFELAGQHRLGISGHVDQREALAREPLALGAGGEPRTLDHHHGAAVDHAGQPARPRRSVGQYGSAKPTWMPPESK